MVFSSKVNTIPVLSEKRNAARNRPREHGIEKSKQQARDEIV